MDWTRLPLARANLDRSAIRRAEPDLLERTWADPGTRVLLVADGRIATRPAASGSDRAVDGGGSPGGIELDLRTPASLAHLLPDGATSGLLLFLGALPGAIEARVDGRRAGDGRGDYLALVLPARPDLATPDVGIEGVAEREPPGEGTTWETLRDVGHALGDRDAGLAATAVGLAAWHERHPRCPRCGAPTAPVQGGWVRRCTVDGSDHYPRTDPAVIMAVLDPDDRLLLGHAAHWPARRFSTLAGYVEPGESLEAAVRREVAEEVGIVIGGVTYRGSQPWPFPASLMLAFVAQATTTDVVVDGVELTDARWFTREGLHRAVVDRDVLLPMQTSVARALIEEWFGEELRTPGR